MPRSRKSEIQQLRAEMADLGRRLMELTDDSMEDMQDNASASFADALENLKGKWSQAREFGSRTGTRVQEYAEENPWQMLAAGAAVGFMVALMLKRDRD